MDLERQSRKAKIEFSRIIPWLKLMFFGCDYQYITTREIICSQYSTFAKMCKNNYKQFSTLK